MSNYLRFICLYTTATEIIPILKKVIEYEYRNKYENMKVNSSMSFILDICFRLIFTEIYEIMYALTVLKYRIQHKGVKLMYL